MTVCVKALHLHCVCEFVPHLPAFPDEPCRLKLENVFHDIIFTLLLQLFILWSAFSAFHCMRFVSGAFACLTWKVWLLHCPPINYPTGQSLYVYNGVITYHRCMTSHRTDDWMPHWWIEIQSEISKQLIAGLPGNWQTMYLIDFEDLMTFLVALLQGWHL